MEDTDARQRARYFELLRAMTPSQRFHRACSLSRTVRELAMVGLRERHPHADEHELRVRLVVLLYGRELALRVYKSIPDDAR
jgi:hypothetical protein